MRSEVQLGQLPEPTLPNRMRHIHGKGIATMLGKINTKRVVVKVQMREQARQEYMIHERLIDCDGIVPYYCLFTCNGDTNYIHAFGTHKEIQNLCDG